MDFDPEMFGAAIGKGIRDAVAPLEARIEGMQVKLDRCAQFAGSFEAAQEYSKGALVKHGDGLYIAIKAIRSGGNVRDGSGWQKLI